MVSLGKRETVAFTRGMKGNIVVLTRVNVCVKTKLTFIYQTESLFFLFSFYYITHCFFQLFIS